MMELYSKKVCEISEKSADTELDTGLSHLNKKEKEFLLLLLNENCYEFTPTEISKKLSVTNKTIINRSVNLVNTGFLIPNIVKERIRSYSLSEFAKDNKINIISKLTDNY